ncbi:MAG: hypothetical protein CVU87_02720 [Firmicutes bacterium HGW-Firmicutes-12]|jgi:phage replication O-like protein O|nr:MAG: hypothetical protein CVU87_02720 [Firmicutes bacterium HGW-Firmicutes-12]
MANPQKENGYTPVANEIIEQLVKWPLNGTQMRIILTIWRYCYGFNRKNHEFSITFLMRALGLNTSQNKQVRRELKTLIELGIIQEIEKPTKNTSRKLAFNKNYEQWSKKNSGRNGPEDKLDHRSDKTEMSGLIRQKTAVEKDHQEKRFKTKSKEIIYKDDFEKFWSFYPRKVEKIAAFKAWNTRLKEGEQPESIIKAAQTYAAECKRSKTEYKYIKHGSTFLGPNKPFLDYIITNEIEPINGYRDEWAID